MATVRGQASHSPFPHSDKTSLFALPHVSSRKPSTCQCYRQGCWRSRRARIQRKATDFDPLLHLHRVVSCRDEKMPCPSSRPLENDSVCCKSGQTSLPNNVQIQTAMRPFSLAYYSGVTGLYCCDSCRSRSLIDYVVCFLNISGIIIIRGQDGTLDQSLHRPKTVRHSLPSSTLASNLCHEPWAWWSSRASASEKGFEPMLPYFPRPGLSKC